MKLFRITDDKKIDVIQEYSYRNQDVGGFGEVTLQEILTDYPELIPSEEINSEDPPKFLVIRREAGVTAGSIDILLVDHNGVPTVVETKLIDNREIRLSVLAQGLEYLAHLKSEWAPERLQEEAINFWTLQNSDLETESLKRLEIPFDEDFLSKITSNISQNKMRLIIAADKIPPELRRIIEFLNDASAFDVFGIEVRYFAAIDNNYKILAPHLVGYSETTKERKLKISGLRWNYDRFFDAISSSLSEDEVSFTKELFDFGKKATGREVEWGIGKESGSFSPKFVISKDRFSLFSVITTGEVYITVGWNTYRFNKLGYDFPVEFKARIKKEFLIEFSDQKWEAGYIILKLSAIKDKKEEFEKYITDFVVYVKDLLHG